MQKIELLGGKLEVVLLESALTAMLSKLKHQSDIYNVADDVANLLEQVEYIKATWEEN
jgi:hypothetical protein